MKTIPGFRAALAFIVFALGLPAVAAQIRVPANDYENGIKDQIKALQESIAEVKSERLDVSDRRSNLMLRILKEMLKEKADEAAAQKDPQKTAYLQQEITDLQSLRDDVWAHSIKIRELDHQLQLLRVAFLKEVLARIVAYCEGMNDSQTAAILKQKESFLEKAQLIENQKYELSQKAVSEKEKDDFEEVPEIRLKIEDLKKQYDKLIFDTQEKMREIGLKRDEFLQGA